MESEWRMCRDGVFVPYDRSALLAGDESVYTSRDRFSAFMAFKAVAARSAAGNHVIADMYG